jgi:DNA-binding NtrC family response regulator
MIKLLVVDDEEPFRRLLKKELTRKGFSIDVAPEGEIALRMLKENPYDVMLLDILMPGIDGISLMKKLRKDPSAPPTIVLTAKATIETAVEAMRNGAYDYLTKPYKLDELEIVINRAYEYGNLRFKNRLLKQELVRKESPVEIIGSSSQLSDILTWHLSKRSQQPFIALNCASLSESLMESELFGHEKGAFTTAYQTKYGIVEVASGGTLFLDEIAEMSLGLQAKLLRFLDSGEFRRVGGNKTLKVNVRVLAATNKNISERVEQGKFREDLFYRLNVFNISVPPLRERRQDIPELSRHFLDKYSQRLSKKVSGINKKAMELLLKYHWPGNVRELENEIERAVTLCDSDIIGPEDLTIKILPSHEISKEFPMLEELEKDYILRVLRETSGNQSKASQILGINRKTLYLKLKSYGITDFKKQEP